MKILSLELILNLTRCFLVEIFSVSEDKAKGYVVALLSIVLRALCYVRLHLGSLKLALEWVSWGRGRVNYLGLTVIFFFF